MIEWLQRYGDRFIDGTWLTLELLLLSSLIGLVIAVPLALMRLSRHKGLWMPAYGYIYLFQGTPMLVQLFLIYYGFAQFEWIRESSAWIILREAYWCGLIALSLNTAAYVAQILRGAIRAVPRGQIEAAQAFGMKKWLIYYKVILPFVVRSALPAYANEVTLQLKSSALVSTITVLDLMGVTRTIFSRTYALEVFIIAAIGYLLITLVLTLFFRSVEWHLNRHLKH